MRLRLLRRRLTISAPRMAVRSALPWPFRWALIAIVMGFCAAIGLWAFELGREIAGLERGSRQELQRLQAEVQALHAELEKVRAERDRAQYVANTADATVTAEKAASAGLVAQNKQLLAENQSLRDDLGFFEKLIPVSATAGLSIRSLQVESNGRGQVRWQVLAMQSGKTQTEFNGQLELMFQGTQAGKPWSGSLPGELPTIKVAQYSRISGDFSMPTQVVLRSVTARLLEGSVVRATHTQKL